MRFSRLKFKKIEELKLFIELLEKERNLNSNNYSTIIAKIDAGEYVVDNDKLFAITLEELITRQNEIYHEQGTIELSLINKKLELRVMLKDRNKTFYKYKRRGNLLSFKKNKNETKTVAVGKFLLVDRVKEIRFNVNQKKDILEFVLLFDNGMILTKYIALDKIVEIHSL